MEKKTILYVSDLDGTLLNRRQCLSAYTRHTLNKLVEEGMQFTYATARSLHSARKVTEGLTLTLPVIVYNGAFIMRADTKEILYAQTFQEEERKKAQCLMEQFDVSPFVYTFLDGKERVLYRAEIQHEGRQQYLNQRKGDERFLAVKEQESLYQGEIFYYTCIGDKETLEPFYQAIQVEEAYRVLFQQELYRSEYWCEIMPKKASKAEALSVLKAMLGCEHVVSFGDAINDIAMFEHSNRCYAVENAVQELKERATSVIGENENDGVARWLEEEWRE